MPSDEYGLTPRQRAFADEYLADTQRNASRAYRKVYSVKDDRVADVNASRLLTAAKVGSYIAAVESRRRALAQAQADVTDAWLVERWRRIIEFDVRKLFDADGKLKPISELDDDTAFVISAIDVSLTKLSGASEDKVVEEVTKKFRALDKTKALEALGQHIGFYARDNAQKRPVVILNGFARPALEGQKVAGRVVAGGVETAAPEASGEADLALPGPDEDESS